jgi:glycosyltransferase involved in cell wall biosynthesis
MSRIKASVVVIGFYPEDYRSPLFFQDFMENLKRTYEEVIYIKDDDRGESLYLIDSRRQDVLNIGKLESLPTNLWRLLEAFFKCWRREKKLIKKIKKLRLKHQDNFAVALDDTALFIAQRYFKSKIVFWSLDILTKDAPWRLKGGLLQKVATSNPTSQVKALIIQDENRKNLLQKSTGRSFPNTIYFPTSLNDSKFCKEQAKIRQKKLFFPTVNIIQHGVIFHLRLSDLLIDAFQNWPSCYKLHLHGKIAERIKCKISRVRRKPAVSEFIYDSEKLPQFLNNFDIGFVGYSPNDLNQLYVENASEQLVLFLRLGIPIIGCGFDGFKNFILKSNVGVGIEVSSMSEISEAIEKIVKNYSFFSFNARKLFEEKFDARKNFDILSTHLRKIIFEKV